MKFHLKDQALEGDRRTRTVQPYGGYPGSAPEIKRRPVADRIVSNGETVIINVDVAGIFN